MNQKIIIIKMEQFNCSLFKKNNSRGKFNEKNHVIDIHSI
jgi:hypothetical protein